MPGNTFGQLFRLTTFGESHGAAIGGIIDGCPSRIPLDEAWIQERLDRRKPGSVGLVGTARKESDKIKVLSGLFEGHTTGTPIAFCIANEDQRSHDYGELSTVFRPGHADMSYTAKYGIRDYRGGGRSSGRETAARVAGGAIAEAVLATKGINVLAATIEMGGIAAAQLDMEKASEQKYFAADGRIVEQWDACVDEVRKEGDTLGGIVQIVARNVPAGLGEPVFYKLDAMLALALMSVGAVKGIEIGTGFAAARSRGSHNNDPMYPQNSGSMQNCLPKNSSNIAFASNNAGGILGGISSGQDIVIRVAVKPIPSIAKPQQTIDCHGKAATITVGGRHDICAIPRIVPVLAAMTNLVLADALLLQERV